MNQDPGKILTALSASVLFQPDFPKRPCHSISAWALLPEEKRRRFSRISCDAMERARTVYRSWEEGVQMLGALHHAPAVPLLSELWRDCALVPVRVSAGYALLAMGIPAAYDALEALITDREHVSVNLGVRAIFRRNPLTAFERFAPLFVAEDATSAVIGHEVLSLFAPSALSPDGTAHWIEPDAPSWLRQDPRWITLCAELLQDERHGDEARAVLHHADSSAVLPVLDAVRVKRPPAPMPATQAIGNLLAHYKAGDHFGAWQEARAFGAIAGDLRAEVVALADETMTRVAGNVALISERLRQEGWKTLGPMRSLPELDDIERIAAIEQMTGAPLPPSLEAFWRIVGGVSWAWDYDQDEAPLIADLPLAEIDTDALLIEPCSTIEPLCFDGWEDQKNVIHPDLIGPFRMDLSPDRLHKMNISGGPSYAVDLPFFGADPLFRQEDQSLPFVDYLRDCFAWAGFPHLKYHADQAAVRRFISILGRGLEPF